MANIQIFSYKGNDVAFDLTTTNVMVNATEMAKAFGKLPADFLRASLTKKLIEAIKARYGNSHNEIVRTAKNGGTWMNRKLALEFAAWLNPDFRLWILDIIEKILFGKYDLLNEINTQLQITATEVKNMEQKFLINIPDFAKYQQLKTKLTQLRRRRNKFNDEQILLFV